MDDCLFRVRPFERIRVKTGMHVRGFAKIRVVMYFGGGGWTELLLFWKFRDLDRWHTGN